MSAASASVQDLRPAPLTRIGGIGRAGLAVSLVLFAAILAWLHFAIVGGAVVAAGEVIVRGKPKEVQSLDGGIISEILVEEGDRVVAGQVLMRLDPALIEIDLDIHDGRLADAVLRERRLQAEYAGAEAIDFASLPSHIAGRDLTREMDGQRTLFEARRAVLEGLRAQLTARAEQADEEIAGLDARIAALGEQRVLLERELETARALVAKGLMRENSLLDLESRHSALMGDVAALRASRAQAEAGVREARLEVVQAERRFRETAVTELRDATLEREQLMLQIATLENQLKRVSLAAPVDGTVHDVRIATLGGVVAPGESVMQIVPSGEGMEFAVRVEPRAIDDVHVGQAAKVIFPAFNARTTPEVHGQVVRVPPSAVVDPATGAGYFRLSVEIPPEEIARLGEVDLIPGMPVEAFLQTGDRPVLSYLIKPLTDQLRRAFRED